jgi:hypothetical protein
MSARAVLRSLRGGGWIGALFLLAAIVPPSCSALVYGFCAGVALTGWLLILRAWWRAAGMVLPWWWGAFVALFLWCAAMLAVVVLCSFLFAYLLTL